MKLKQLLNNFQPSEFKQNERNYFKLFDRCLDNVFPETQSVVKYVEAFLNPQYREEIKSYKTTYNFLPHNLVVKLNDNEWLAKYLQLRIKYLMANSGLSKSITKMPQDIPLAMVERYVVKSTKLKQKRLAFKDKIVKACIAYCQKNDEDCTTFYGVQYVDLLRTKIYASGIELGIGFKEMDYSIEKHADLWRDEAINVTVHNLLKMDSHFLGEDKRATLRDIDAMTMSEFEAREAELIALLKADYELRYYKSHQHSIDKCGKKTPMMKLNYDEQREFLKKVYHAQTKYTDNSATLLAMANQLTSEKC